MKMKVIMRKNKKKVTTMKILAKRNGAALYPLDHFNNYLENNFETIEDKDLNESQSLSKKGSNIFNQVLPIRNKSK